MRRTTRLRSKVQMRDRFARPRIETLEQRLPPGDVLRAQLWGASWFGAASSTVRMAQSGVSSTATPIQQIGAETHSPEVTLVQSQAPEQVPSRNTLSLIVSTATSPIGVDNNFDPLAATDALANPGGSHGAAPLSHSVSSPVTMSHASGAGASAAPVAAPATAGTVSSMSSFSAMEFRPASDVNSLVASELIAAAGAYASGQGGLGSARSHGGVHALFHLDMQTEAPFPTNLFTVPDHTQNTNLRVNLPLPDCKIFVSDCEDLAVINELDGFNLQPRLSIPFDGAIDANSVNSNDVFLISLGDTLDHHDHGGQVVGINQVIWDPDTNTLHAKSDDLLDQHTRYALIVTNGIHDPDGNPVAASAEFRHLRRDVHGEYRHELEEAVHAARRAGIRERDIVDASVFTTESATAILEKIRDQIHAATPAPADFNLGPSGERTVFNRADVAGIHWEQQTGDKPPSFTGTDLNLTLLDAIPSAVGQIAYGRYVSPDYEVHPDQYIPPVGTRTGMPAVQGVNEIYFNLVLPTGPRPASGWPVAIFGHGSPGSKDALGGLLNVAASMAAHGIATIEINGVGDGFGSLGMLTVNQTDGGATTFSSGGRGVDLNDDGIIDNNEGRLTPAPRTITWNRDALLQTNADYMQLVRVIEVGIDIDGHGVRDLDPSRIYYFGQSYGGIRGTYFLAVEPDVRVGVINVAGGQNSEFFRLGNNRPAVGTTFLAARTPSLLNSPGITSIEGVSFGAEYFNENLPLRNGVPLHVHLADGTDAVIQSPVINTVPGATAIQEVLDNYEWVLQPTDAVAYAPHLRKNPLAGVPAKQVLFQFAKGDQNVPNPSTTAILRAGDLADRATYYRHDLAYADNPALATNPHPFMIAIGMAAFRPIALEAQRQIATFFETNGQTVIQPEPVRYFETPINLPLPEDLNYIT